MSTAEVPEMKHRIVVAATRLFADQGFDGTSIQAIADAVGIRKPSLLYHFPSKDALRSAVLEDMLSHWKDHLPRLLLSAEKGKERLDVLLTALIDFFLGQPQRARLIVREMLDRPEAMRDLFHTHLQPWTRLITDAIRTGQDSGRVHADVDPESYLLQVVSMAIGTVATGETAAAMLAGEQSVEHQIRELVRIARTALFAPRPTAGEP